MGLVLLEALVLCGLFTLMVVPSVYRDPMAWAAEYPPRVVERLREQGLLPEGKPVLTPAVIVKKLLFCLFAAAVLAAVMVKVNGASGFQDAFLTSCVLWLAVTWYDALVLDCLWFARSRKIRLPGTEEMDSAYRDYGFHIRMSALGSLLGLPVCLLVGVLAALVLRL